MTITTTTDEELRKIIFEKERVIVKFIDEECNICKLLAPKFQNLSQDPAYKEVTFLKMDASENPVSSKEVKLTGTPFFASYFKGTLLECGLLAEEEDVRKMLNNLLLQN